MEAVKRVVTYDCSALGRCAWIRRSNGHPLPEGPSRGGAASEVRGWTGLGALVSPQGNVSGAESLKAGGNKDHLLQVK